jgi:RNA polymerase sigma-70 factor (ECF subfamily)
MTFSTDEAAFTAAAEPHRHELRVHCYRMLGSFQEAEDLVQETFLRAWRRRDTFQGRSTFRAWLYRIATNACLDALDKRPRQPAGGEVAWLQPFPDELLDQVASGELEPDAELVAKETIELAFMVAIQHVPPRSRAVLIVRDVLGWSAKETAALLDMSVPAANSALQRARAALQEHLPERRLEWSAGADPTSAERALVARYVEATERGDAQALAAMLTEDATFSMPPEPGLFRGRDHIVGLWVEGGFGTDRLGAFRCVPTHVNRQPAVACYVRHPGEEAFTAFALDVLRLVEGEIADITTFHAETTFAPLGLPPVLP